MKTPNTKHQTPDKHQTPNAKRVRIASSEAEFDTGSRTRSEPWVLKDGPLPPSQTREAERHPFDLEERTAVFGERIVRFSKRIPRGPTNDRLIDQLVGAGTSGGANYCEANDCVSKKDFRFIIKRCIKETKEARFFLRMIAASEPSLTEEARALYREATELIKIFASMHNK